MHYRYCGHGGVISIKNSCILLVLSINMFRVGEISIVGKGVYQTIQK